MTWYKIIYLEVFNESSFLFRFGFVSGEDLVIHNNFPGSIGRTKMVLHEGEMNTGK